MQGHFSDTMQQQITQVQQPTLYPQPQSNQIVYIQTTQPPVQIYNNYSSKQSLGLGITQIICGVIAIILNIALLAVSDSSFGVVGYGFWCGIFFLISGGFGVGAGRSPTGCMLVTHMVMSIVSACFASVILSLGVVGALIDSDGYNCSYYGCDTDSLIAINSIIAILGLLEFVCAIWASAICCAGMCCNNRPLTGTVIAQPPQQNVAMTVPAGNQVVHQTQYTQQQYTYPQPDYTQSTAATAPILPTYREEPPSYETKE